MAATKKLLAFDLGAESGRGILGLFDGGQLRLEVVHRFPNRPVRTLDTIHWDVLRLWDEMQEGMRRAAGTYQTIDSVGVDTWGVDFALMGRGNTLLANPRHYRDPHTEGIMETAFARVPRAEVFRHTGLQFMRFNTLFQLLALQRDRSPLLDAAETLLFMPDLFHFYFTGIKVNEMTDASTSQMFDPNAKTWAYGLVKSFALPSQILGSLVSPGTVIGPLRSTVAAETGLNPAPVIAPATHDTAAAVAAVPATGTSWAYLSSGTWSLMGVEVNSPVINDKALEYNFTNEGGVDGTVRLLKNIMGLWLVQECRRAWAKEGKEFSYVDLMRLAEAVPPCRLINPDHSTFVLPQHMPAAIANYCRRSGQAAPIEPGEYIRCALDSLALRYRWVLERLEELIGKRIETVHIVGGGCQNTLLCQLTAEACNRPVLAGPVEATAMGNVLVQAMGLGLVRSLAQAREVVRRSVEVQVYQPKKPGDWEEPYNRFVEHLSRDARPEA
jgi:rhamnulokinase